MWKRDHGWFSTAKPGDEQISLKEHVERPTGRMALVELSGIGRSEMVRSIPRGVDKSMLSGPSVVSAFSQC